MLKTALREAKELLEYFIDCDDDFEEEEIESIRHFLKALNAGCSCDAYYGFDCGCGRRALLSKEGLKELEAISPSLPTDEAFRVAQDEICFYGMAGRENQSKRAIMEAGFEAGYRYAEHRLKKQ